MKSYNGVVRFDILMISQNVRLKVKKYQNASYALQVLVMKNYDLYVTYE